METKLSVKIDPRGAQEGGSVVDRVLNGIGAGFLNTSAKAFVFEQAMEKVWRMALKGAQFEETMSRLNRQMGGFHSTAQLMVGDLEAISNGQISVAEAATMASRALSVGLNPDQVSVFTKAAEQLGDVMGTDIPMAFDNLVQAAITGRSAILGNIGIYVDLDEEVKKLAVSTGRTTDQITKQEKVMLTTKAINQQTEASFHRLSDGMLSDADRLQQVMAKWKNYWTDMEKVANAGVQQTILGIDTLFSYVKEHTGKFLPGAGLLKLLPSHEFFGPPNPGNLGLTPPPVEPPKPFPTSLRGGQLEAEFARQETMRTAELDRTKAMLQAKSALYDTDVQRQIATAEEVVHFKSTLALQEIAKQGETLSVQLAREQEFYAQRTKIGFDSTEERLSEETRHKDKVVEINQSLLASAQAFGLQTRKNEADEAIARDTAEKARGDRQVEQFRSEFEIKEELRRKDLDDAQVYYQGEADMAIARYASDAEIAAKERELLREQLAFKLRLTQEEVDRMLFLRKFGDLEGARNILDRGDPTLSRRAREGMLESGEAKDIRLAERANNDFFAGWARGLQDYTQRTAGAFNMSNDMAKRTAQAMEQGFQQFFFDGMEGKFQSFKDVMTGVLDFTKKIVSQIAAQMVTLGIIDPAMAGLRKFFTPGAAAAGAADFSSTNFFAQRNGGIMPIEHYDTGGITSRPQLALFGEGSQPEAFVPLPDGRTIPVTLRHAGSSDLPTVMNNISVQIVNQVPQAEVSAQRQTGPGGQQEILIMIEKAVDANLANGRHDKTLGQRFRMTPGRG
jgi:hypothetical protein